MGKMVLWDTSPPSSWSAGFPNKVTIPCPNTSPLDLLACRAVSQYELGLVTISKVIQQSVYIKSLMAVGSITLVKKSHPTEFPGSPVVRILRFHCRSLGSIPGRGTRIPQATQHGQKKETNPIPESPPLVHVSMSEGNEHSSLAVLKSYTK